MYPKKREKKISSSLYYKYKYDIFPKIEHIRGATRLKKLLGRFSRRNIPKADESQPIKTKEWENLVILDAARFDTYKETINNNCEKRISAESHSRGFIRENFSEGDWSDTVVITANPFYNKKEFRQLTKRNLDNTFHTVFQVWDTDWNKEEGTVMPDKVMQKAKTAQKLFPEKRKIVHFMQPHHPFIESEIDDPGFGDTKSGINKSYKKVWQKVALQDLNHQEVLQGYIQNHYVVKPYISKLEEIFEEFTVTADHGNLLGEEGLYGHPDVGPIKALRTVPWDKREE